MRHYAPMLAALAALGLTLIPTPGRAGESQHFADYARVMDVTPVVERVRVPVLRRVCGELPDGTPLRLRVLPVAPGPDTSLAQDIREQQRLPQTPRPACRELQAYETREQVLGYNVRYRYRGRLAVRRMDHRPGDRVPVEVVLEPAE